MTLQPMWRVSVQVPLAALDAVRAGILAVDALAAGGYDSGLFEQAAGIEQYRPLPGTDARMGRPGRCSACPVSAWAFICRAMRRGSSASLRRASPRIIPGTTR